MIKRDDGLSIKWDFKADAKTKLCNKFDFFRDKQKENVFFEISKLSKEKELIFFKVQGGIKIKSLIFPFVVAWQKMEDKNRTVPFYSQLTSCRGYRIGCVLHGHG